MSTPAVNDLRILDATLPLSEAMCRVVLDRRPGEAGRDAFDLSRTMILVPGGRIVPALERALLAAAKSQGRPLIAPTIVTPLMLSGRLIVPSRPVLSSIAARQAWRESLERSRVADDGLDVRVASVFGGVGAGIASIDDRARMRLSRRLQRLSSEVAAAMHTIEGVAVHPSVHERPDLAGHLATLAELAARRTSLLDEAGVADRDDALRDAVAAAQAGSAARDLGSLESGAFDRIVVLLADPEPVQRALLDALRARGVQIEVCVHSAEGVDAQGFPIAAVWEQREFAESLLGTDAIRVGEGPSESAREAVAAVRSFAAALGRAPTSDEIAIMAPDGETRRELERELELEGSAASAFDARAFAATRIGTLLARLSALLAEGSAEALSDFVRHDDVATWLGRAHGIADAGTIVSAYRSETLVGAWMDEVVESARARAGYADVRSAIAALVSDGVSPRPACEWARPLRAIIRAVVGDDTRGAFDGERAGSIRVLDRALAELADIPAQFATPIGLGEAIELILDQVGATSVRGERLTDGVSIVGWLDAGMSDEALLVLAGFADGQVPQAAPADPVLPDDLRRALGLPSGRRYAARDAWILDGILTRARARVEGGVGVAGGGVVVVVPRRTAEGDPLRPSRFLLRVPAERLPARVMRLFPTESGQVRLGMSGPETGVADFGNTPPVPGAAIDAVRVTAFKTFLKCPYLFQLQIDPRLRLESQDERAVELDAMGFGTLVHAALEGWGREESASSRRTELPARIEASILSHLDAHVAAHHPKSRPAALRVQVEIARSRLRRFAALQAAQAQAGWRVHAVERSFAKSPVGGAMQSPRFPDADGVYLTGRIDRVDVLEGTDRFRALDYKTSTSAQSPTDAHMKITGGKKARVVEWTDLQLPLYRVLLRSLARPERVGPNDLGYVNLAPSLEKSGFVWLEANDADLEQAENLARSSVAEIRAGRFVPAEGVPLWADDPLGPIWGVGMRSPSVVAAGVAAVVAAARGDE